MSFSGISLVQFVVFSVYWIAAAILLWGQFKPTDISIQWISFSAVSLYLIVYFLIALLHHKFMKDERNTGWCYGDDEKHTNHSTATAAMFNENLNEIQPMTTATTMTIKSNRNIESRRECEKKLYRKVGQRELDSTFS